MKEQTDADNKLRADQHKQEATWEQLAAQQQTQLDSVQAQEIAAWQAANGGNQPRDFDDFEDLEARDFWDGDLEELD
jgi:hypothetical protein